MSIADLGWRLAALTAGIHDLFIHFAVAIIVESIADLEGFRTTTAAAVEKALIDFTIAIVVESIADFLAWKDLTSAAILPALGTALQSPSADTDIHGVWIACVANSARRELVGLIRVA